MNEMMIRAEAVFRMVWEASWQAAALAGLVLAAQRVLERRLSAAWRHGLWFVVIARLLLPVTPASPWSVFNLARRAERQNAETAAGLNWTAPAARAMENHDTEKTMQAVSVARGSEKSVATLPTEPARATDWVALATLGWFSGAIFFGGRLFWSNARFLARLNRLGDLAEEEVRAALEEARVALGIREEARLVECDELESPAVYGWRRKWILLPSRSWREFSREQLRCIFLHELAHIKRRDLAVNWVMSVLQAAHWFNPALWFAFARMRSDRELAADELALAQAPKTENIAYGETILKVVEGLGDAAALTGAVGIAESKAGLKARLRAIAQHGRTRPWKWAAAVAALALAGVGLTNAQTGGATGAKAVIPGKQVTAIAGHILDPDGKPATGAQVAAIGEGSELCLTGKPEFFNPDYPNRIDEPHDAATWSYCTTDAKGRFEVNDLKGALFLVAASKNGFARLETNEFSAAMTVKLKPWGRVTGTVWDYEQPVSGRTVQMYPFVGQDWIGWGRDMKFETRTDARGRFVFDYVPAEVYGVLDFKVRKQFKVTAGKTTIADLGDGGRPVVGRFTAPFAHPPFEWGRKSSDDLYFLTTVRAKEESHPEFKSVREFDAWKRAHPPTPPSLDERLYYLQCASDGTFHIDHVEPGKYDLEVTIADPTNGWVPINPKNLGDGMKVNYIAGCMQTIEVAADPANPRAPLDVGTIELKERPDPDHGW